jgi:outer membrane protein
MTSMRHPWWSLALVLALSGAWTPSTTQAQTTRSDTETTSASPRDRSPGDTVEILDLGAYLRGEGSGLTSDMVARRALETAPSLDSARAAVRTARAGAARAYLGFFPRFEITARYTRLSPVTNPSVGGGSITPEQEALARMLIAEVDDPAAQALFTGNLEAQLALAQGFSFPVILDQFSIGGELTYPISDVFFQVLPGYEAAERGVDASEDQLRARASEVAQNAREAYYNLARARAAHAVATSTITTIEAQRTVVAATVEAGLAARVDLMRLDAQLASAQVASLRAEGGVAVSEEAIRTLMHTDEALPSGLGEDLLAPLPELTESRDDLMVTAIENRPEAEAIRDLIRLRDRSIEAAEGSRYPHLIASGSLSFDNPSQRVFPQSSDRFIDTWSVSVILSWSPNDFFTGEVAAEEARAGRATAEADLEALEDGIRLQLTSAYENYRAARAALGAAQVGIDAATESVRVRTEQYRAGTATITELMSATADLARAQLDLVTAAIDARIAMTQLRRATGEDRAWDMLGE